MPFIPHTEQDIQEMLSTIGVNTIADLFDEIPKDLIVDPAKLAAIPISATEMELTRELQAAAAKDNNQLCFIGAGAYEHHIPAAVWDIVSRGEFMTAYTPYQAEASQGTLQLLYEYQTMMASLTGMEVSNASMYDGASALAEAILMAIRSNRHTKSQRILVASTIHPAYQATAKTVVTNQQIELVTLPYNPELGRIDIDTLKNVQGEFAALVIAQPNFFGVLEDVDALTDWAHQHNMLVIASVNPTSLALLKPPGQWGKQGADIVTGEGQPLGVPLASGGPYFGFMTTRKEFVRQMPGRIIGRTIDMDGKVGFALTLQAREQHIRRSKATSNICTNQGLLVTAGTIYMSLLGYEGLQRVATHCHQNTKQLAELLSNTPGVTVLFQQPYFHEIVVRLDQPVRDVLAILSKHGIQAGYDLQNDYPELTNCLLICATETKTKEDLKHFQTCLASALRGEAMTDCHSNAAIV